MGRATLFCILLVVLVQQQILATREIISAGFEYRKDCPITTQDPERYVIQFFTDKTEVKIFNHKTSSHTFRLVSNGSAIVPTIANQTDRYSVQEINGRYQLSIKNAVDSDSAWYGCRSFNWEQNKTHVSVASTELLVPGPFEGVFWTTRYSNLSLDEARKNEIPDRGVVLTNNAWYGPNVACVVLVSNMEPVVNITIGHYWDPKKVDITDQFDTRISSTVTIDAVGTSYRESVFFVKKSKFTQTSLRDVFCRAFLLRTRHEKSVNIQVPSKPQNKACDPVTVEALVGSKGINLTCLIEAHPEPDVEWRLPGGQQINALSNNPNYTLTNEAKFEGLLTTLTISEVTEEDNVFGRITINANNTEGSGEHYLNFKRAAGAAGASRPSAVLIATLMCLLPWMLH